MSKRAILDTSAMLARPEILAHVGNERLLIPEAVVHELTRARSGRASRDIGALVAQATTRGAKVVKSTAPLSGKLLAASQARGLAGADLEIVQVAIEYVQRLGPLAVLVVTEDQPLQRFLAERDIKSLTAAEFLREPSTNEPDAELQRSAKSLSSSQTRFAIISALVGLASSIVGSFLFANLDRLIGTFSAWGTAVGLPLLGVALYWYRQRFRLSYGIFEFLIGATMAYYVLFPNFSYSMLSMVQGIQILGGLYVMVRGLDNIGKGVEGTRSEVIWRKLFS